MRQHLLDKLTDGICVYRNPAVLVELDNDRQLIARVSNADVGVMQKGHATILPFSIGQTVLKYPSRITTHSTPASATIVNERSISAM
jgi:hypothetical protein